MHESVSHQTAWVGKVVNPNSTVLTNVEAADFLSKVSARQKTLSNQTPEPKKGSKTRFHTVILDAAEKYLESCNESIPQDAEKMKKAFQKLSKHRLTFIEKLNVIHLAPKTVPDILCMLDDLGIRFTKSELESLEKDCVNLYGN
ncbi:hypothetical protein FO519_006157 [Halicephalobus sp. NKZ332]|nr:hypothetical protein FO519_006157 [Halicephalobus sp. NKZ332]